MKKSKIFLTAGALVLAITAMFATKANKKYFSVTTGYIGGTGTYIKFSTGIITTASSGNQLVYVTLYSSASRLVTRLKTASGHTLYHL
jgi:hypothetical protein